MYSFKKCIEVSDRQIYEAFRDGFADYIIQANMTQEQLISRFFGIEGNERELSFVAFRNNRPIGIILGGIKTGEIFKTLRCGAMSLIPEERGSGVATKLFELHEGLARDIGCKQLFLEVIDSNDRAISFYKKMGYEKIYDLTYMNWEIENKEIIVQGNNPLSNAISVISHEDLYSLREEEFSHLPWQGEFSYFKQLSCNYYGIREDDRLIAGLAGAKNKILYIWVNPRYRLKGYARALLNRLIVDTDTQKLNITYTNNSELHTFAKHYGMEKNKINQLEMYKWLY
ncbi:GNAT family N-acetyltransferase [Wukongibacter baidiensis]|uniref:GNAT family N-acetyltransferase n=1 Tax=Wukongibacter baidiensis TaxID=1723361 RepID=UPI003D7F6794